MDTVQSRKIALFKEIMEKTIQRSKENQEILAQRDLALIESVRQYISSVVDVTNGMELSGHKVHINNYFDLGEMRSLAKYTLQPIDVNGRMARQPMLQIEMSLRREDAAINGIPCESRKEEDIFDVINRIIGDHYAPKTERSSLVRS